MPNADYYLLHAVVFEKVMCGIAGIINYKDGLNPSSEVINKMVEPIHHRGPDNSSTLIGEANHLGHTRLSIIDLKNGNQPVYNADRSISVVFNGEIFNFIELKKEFLSDYDFYTSSDTEVIVALYEKFGIKFIQHLNGQFSIAIIDKNLNKTFLIRDRVGICPLFYSQVGRTIYFASEVKSLLAVPDIKTNIDLASFSEFIHLWTPLSPNTLFKDISEVSPGYYLEIDQKGVKRHCYWDFEYQPGNFDLSISDAVYQLDNLLEDAVNIRLRSDVPVGAYLSGGLDSTVILSYLHKNGVNLSTFSLTFADDRLNEAVFQKDVTDFFSTRHHSIRVDNSSIAENFVKCIRHTESPLFRTSPTPMMLLSGKVHEAGYKVVLTGEGSDEVFGGYDIFKEAKIREFWARNPNSSWRPLLLERLYPYLDFSKIKSTDYLKQVFGHSLSQIDDLLYAYHTRIRTTSGVTGFLVSDVKDQVNHEMETRVRDIFPISPGQYNVFNTAQYIESKTIMPGYILSSQGDRMLMANSVEGRYPFLDHRVIEFAANLRNSHKMQGLNEKFILKKIVKNKIPDSVLNRHKQPYRAPDINALMCSKDNHLLDYLSENEIRNRGLFDHKKVNLLMKKALSGKAQSVKDNMLFTIILSTQIWLGEFIH